MLTWINATFINFNLTTFPSKSRRAVTDKLINAIFTSSTVDTRIRSAFVYIAKASSVEISAGTVTFKTVNLIDTFSAVGAWVACAFVDVCFAVLACVSRYAFARISKGRKIQKKS